MDEMLTTILKEIQQISSRMSEMEKRFDGFERRLDNIEANMATKADIARVEEKITEQKLKTEKKITELETRIDILENQELILKVVRQG